jgi:Arc/MetJ-type ribon-helix-helix transcriptional regulator
MGVVQVQLPDELKSIIDRHVAEGRAASEAAYVTEALLSTLSFWKPMMISPRSSSVLTQILRPGAT